MSDQISNSETTEELKRLGEKLAQDVLERAEANRPPSGDEKEKDITAEDVHSAWPELVSPRPRIRFSPAFIFQFVVLTAVVAAVIFLVFELTATNLTHAESTALVLILIGIFYMLSRLDVLRRRRSSTRGSDIDSEFAEHDLVFYERFDAITRNLSSDKPAIVRLGAAYAMAKLADDWQHYRQTCIDVLCGYLRLSYEDWPSETASIAERTEFRADQEVRNTIVRIITAHRRSGALVSWRGHLDLTGAVLIHADFSGADLQGADLTGANFTHADFSGADLQGADLNRANLTGASFTRANLRGADLQGADLTDAYLTDAILTQAQLFGATLAHANLYGAELESASLTQANLTGAMLGSARLGHANLIGADLRGVDLTRAYLIGAILMGAKLDNARWPEVSPAPKGWIRDPRVGVLRPANTDADDGGT